jgi:3-oxoacyl-[acyl-carrier protein] reductase
MDLGIAGKLALVTGAGRGLGRAIVKELDRAGVTVIAVSRSPQPLESLYSEISVHNRQHTTRCVDLMEEGATSHLIRSVMTDSGLPDIVVHNVGGSLRVTDPLAQRQEWQKVWQLNLGIAIEINTVVVPAMMQKQWGRIVHVSSNATLTFQGYPAYVSAKAALNAYVRTVGRAVAKDNVVMSAVMPGPIFAEDRYLGRLQQENAPAWAEYVQHHLPIGRLAQPEELAPFVVLLCANQASFAVGSVVPVDGGSM